MYLLLKPIVLAALAVIPFAQAQDFSLKYSPKEGSSITYKLTGQMDLEGVQAAMTSTVLQKVLKVDPDGTYSVQSNTLEGKVVYSGQEIAVPKNSAVTLYKPSGEIVSVTGDQVDSSNIRAQTLTMLKRPDANVKIGDSWQIELKADPAAKKPALHGTYKLLGEEAIGAYQTLKIEANVSESEVPLAGSTTSTFWIVKDDGSIVKYDCKYVNMPFAGAPGPLSGSLSMMRIDK